LIWVNAPRPKLGHDETLNNMNSGTIRRFAMTEHLLQEHTEEDQRIMQRLALVVGVFIALTAAMAVAIAITMG
jgi:hypothetical protein